MAYTLYGMITANMERIYAKRAAFHYYDAAAGAVAEKTYAAYAQDIRRAAAYFARTVPEIKGKNICILAKNSYEYAVNAMGIMAAGGVVVPLNYGNLWDEVRYELALTEPAAILTDGIDYGYREQLNAACGELLRSMDGYKSCEPGELSAAAIDPDATMVVMFTSGTTGRSKGVMLTERNFFTSMVAFSEMADAGRAYKRDPAFTQKLFAVLPLFHIGGFASLFSFPTAGWTINLVSDLRDFYKDLKRMSSNYIIMPPMILQTMLHDLRAGRRERYGELEVVCCTSAMFRPEELYELAQHGFLVEQLYASTELCAFGLLNTAQDKAHIGSVGREVFCGEYKLEADGELCIRGGSVMKGYYKDPDATAQVLDGDGWFHTGDLARKDEEGYYYITGRKKNLIILDSGENVSPEELESLLGECAAVQECIVKEKGKKICALVCCEPERQQEVRAHITAVNRTVPMYKRITAVEFSTEPLPRTAAGKLKRDEQ